MTTVPTALSGVPAHDLELLLRKVQRAEVDCPITSGALLACGFGSRATMIASVLHGVDRVGVEAALTVAIAERTHRPPPRLELVWTGPEAPASATRDTAVVVRRLFESARQSVIVAGYRFDHGENLLRPLHVGMKENGVRASFFLDVPGKVALANEADTYAHARIDEFFIQNWPFGQPFPDVFYDPRTVVKGPPWASLHAKCVVVDERVTLIGSANFTERGHERNVEAGVLIEDEDFACRLVAQWRLLVDSNVMRKYGG